MTFDEERNWLSNIRAQADDGGNRMFFSLLRSQVENRKALWELKDEGGAFSDAELTRLIEAAHDLLRRIEAFEAREP